jgi:hypothetical protein
VKKVLGQSAVGLPSEADSQSLHSHFPTRNLVKLSTPFSSLSSRQEYTLTNPGWRFGGWCARLIFNADPATALVPASRTYQTSVGDRIPLNTHRIADMRSVGGGDDRPLKDVHILCLFESTNGRNGFSSDQESWMHGRQNCYTPLIV